MGTLEENEARWITAEQAAPEGFRFVGWIYTGDNMLYTRPLTSKRVYPVYTPLEES